MLYVWQRHRDVYKPKRGKESQSVCHKVLVRLYVALPLQHTSLHLTMVWGYAKENGKLIPLILVSLHLAKGGRGGGVTGESTHR